VRLAVIIVATLMASCAQLAAKTAGALETFQREYSAKPITLKIVDEATGAPIEGVIATANWELVTGSVAGGSVVRGQMKVLESVSDREGMVRFPAWGPEQNVRGGHIEARDPQIFLYKRGYIAMRLNNMNKYGAAPRPDAPEGYSRDSLRVSIWDGDTILLSKTRAGKQAYLQASVSGIASGLNFAFEDRSCEWKRIPRMAQVLLEEKAIVRSQLSEDACGAADFLREGVGR
jgi:hypothetical protein